MEVPVPAASSVSVAYLQGLLDYLDRQGFASADLLAKVQLARIPAAGTLNYYDRALVLFGKGWMDRRYRFSADGRLLPAWSSPCSARP